MIKLDKDDLFNLKHGDRVTKIYHGQARNLRFVGIMPGSKNSLIFSDGEYLESLHINPHDDSFIANWYSGEDNFETIGQELIKWHEKQISIIKKIYLKES